MARDSILIIRLGAMGDIIQGLPVAASLKQSLPEKRILWTVARKWMELLAGNPNIDEVVVFDRGGIGELAASWRRLRALRPAVAIDLQGLMQSALVGRAARPRSFIGLDGSLAREPLAAQLYTRRVKAEGPHRVERNLQLAAAAGATHITHAAWIPEGKPEGELPSGSFVLASPFAGWESKQWPLSSYAELAQSLQQMGMPLVVNVPPGRALEAGPFLVHVSGIAGLIDATRRATAVVGVDSGPLHLAAALGKPGVALYGPTDPAQTGPFHSRIEVLRSEDTETTYKREAGIHPSMEAIPVERVAGALRRALSSAAVRS